MSRVFMEPSFPPGKLNLTDQKQLRRSITFGPVGIVFFFETGFHYGIIGMFTVLLERSILMVQSRVSETSSQS